jgi:hypothetical protein
MNTDTATAVVAPLVAPLVAPIELTKAIVTAAKRVRKSKVAVEPELPSIVDEVNVNFSAGNFTQEAIANLSRVFDREFVIEEEPIVVPSPPVPEAKEKKPRAKKVKSATISDPIVEVEETKPVPVKKARAKKDTVPTVAEPPVPLESLVNETIETKETKPKKTRAKKELPVVVVEEATNLPVVEEEPKKKSRVVKAKKEVAPPVTDGEEAKVEEPKDEEAKKETKEKEKKPRAKKTTTERPSTPVLVEEEQERLPDLGSRITDELEEEELSDIEEE